MIDSSEDSYLERGLLAGAHHTVRGGRHAAGNLLLRGNEQLDRLKARRKVRGELGRDRDLAARWLACPFLIFFLLTSTGIGALFWVQAALQTQAFSVQTFGRFALQFPAEFWAGAMMAGSLVTFGGLMHPPRRWAMR